MQKYVKEFFYPFRCDDGVVWLNEDDCMSLTGLMLGNTSIVYTLLLEDHSIYVGYTTRGIQRIVEHFQGNGAKWTKRYKPVVIINIQHGGENDERKETLRIMRQPCIDPRKVRGGPWTAVDFTYIEYNETLPDDILAKLWRRNIYGIPQRKGCDCDFCECKYENSFFDKCRPFLFLWDTGKRPTEELNKYGHTHEIVIIDRFTYVELQPNLYSQMEKHESIWTN